MSDTLPFDYQVNIRTVIDELFDEHFVSGSAPSVPASDIDPFGSAPPQYFLGDEIDLSSLWLEFFALGYDPYARSDSLGSGSTVHSYGSGSLSSPFSVLRGRR